MGSKKGLVTNGNGYIGGYIPSPSVSTVSSFICTFISVMRSAVPYLIFLMIYGLNNVLHIQPGLEDIGCVHMHTINNIEKFVLGFHPHEVISSVHNTFLDFLSAIPYLIHYVIPVLFPLYLAWRGLTEEIHRFYWLMGWCMWLNYFIWLAFPHTPPWVLLNLQQPHNASTPIADLMEHREGCAFQRLDEYTGLHFFHNMFKGNPILFASFPSGHVAWPTVMYLSGPAPGGSYFILYILYIAWATMYTCHHYLLDAIGAIVMVMSAKKIITVLSDKAVCGADYKCRVSGVACPFHV